MAVGHTVTQQRSWSSAQTLASWLRALLALAGPLSGLELDAEAAYRDRGTAESYPGLPASQQALYKLTCSPLPTLLPLCLCVCILTLTVLMFYCCEEHNH